jgi:hypothetical protein
LDALDASGDGDDAPAAKTGAGAWFRDRKVPLIVLGAVALFAVGGFALGANDPTPGRVAPQAAATPLAEALDTCGIGPGAPGVTLGDSDTALILDGKGDDDISGVTVERQACVLTTIGVPDSTLNLMSTTRALDGRQQGTWDDFDATWSYHPDTGLNLTITSS